LLTDVLLAELHISRDMAMFITVTAVYIWFSTLYFEMNEMLPFSSRLLNCY